MEKLNKKEDFRIARIDMHDATGVSDHLRNLRSLVGQKDDLYPGIERWFDKRVVEGLREGSRKAYVGYLNDTPAAAAIVKLAANTKLCHINVREDLRRTGLGEVLLSLVTLEARPCAKSMHVTFPRSLWADKGEFFRSFGFADVEIARRQYRLFNEELASRTFFTNIWSSVLKKIPKIAKRISLAGTNMEGGVLFSIQPRFGRLIMNGSKTIEIRRRFSKAWKGHRAVFYASEPTGALLGEAQIAEVHEGSPKDLWERFSSNIGCEPEYYDSYVQGCDNVFAIELTSINPLPEPIYSRTLARYTSRHLTSPQSYVALTDKQGWSEAVSVSVMLQCLSKNVQINRANVWSR